MDREVWKGEGMPRGQFCPGRMVVIHHNEIMLIDKRRVGISIYLNLLDPEFDILELLL